MNKTKTLKTVNHYSKKIVVTFKVNAVEMQKLLGFAHGYTKGNVSEWIRYSALNFKPTRKDLKNDSPL